VGFFEIAYCALGITAAFVFFLFFREGYLLGKDIKLLYKEGGIANGKNWHN